MKNVHMSNTDNRKKKKKVFLISGISFAFCIAFVLVLVFAIIPSVTEFNYSEKNLGKYVSLERNDYYGLPVTISDEYKVSVEDVEEMIGILRLDLRTMVESDLLTYHAEWGDTAKIYYYFSIKENGIELPAEGMTNVTGTTPRSLVLGSQSFPTVFEEGIEGYAALECTFSPSSETSETVKAGDTVFVSLNYSLTEKNVAKTGTYSVMRVEMNGSNPFGSDFENALLGLHPGDSFEVGGDTPLSFDGDNDGTPGSLAVSGTVLSVSRGEHILKIEGQFPETYSNSDLAGKDAILYCSIVSADNYDVPELTEEIITENYPSFTATSENIVADFKTYILLLMTEEMASQRQSAIEEKIWDVFDTLDCIKRIPSSAIRQEYQNQLTYLDWKYDYYGALFIEEYGVNPYSSAEEFGYDYYEIGDTDYDDVKDYLKNEVALDTVRQKMIIFRISQLEGLELTEEEYEAGLAEQLAYYAAEDEITEAEAKAKYGETYFREAILYDKVMSFLVDSAVVEYK